MGAELLDFKALVEKMRSGEIPAPSQQEFATPSGNRFASASLARPHPDSGVSGAEIYAALLVWCDKITEKAPIRPLWRFLVGAPGVGKTHALNAVARRLRNSSVTVVQYRESTLFEQVKSRAYDGEHRQTTEGAVKSLIPMGSVLLLDEIGLTRPTETDARIMDLVFDWSYERGIPILAVGNLDREAMGAHLGPRIKSRRQEVGDVMVCDWKSLRATT